MTFKTTVKDSAGKPVQNAYVSCNDETSGASFSRGTDGNGYADVDMKATPINRQITFVVQAAGYVNSITYPTTSQNDQTVGITLVSFNRPFKAAPRFWKGNMCGVRIAGAPSVNGGADDSSLILSWFYDRYPKSWRDIIRTNWKVKGYTHTLLSWPDARVNGMNEDEFCQICVELMDDGFFPCIMLSSKDHDPHDPVSIMIGLDVILPKLVKIGIPMICIGWELSLWLQPVEVQMLIDVICPIFTPIGTKCYVHFQQGYFAFEKDAPGATTADFWNLQKGKLTGVLYQRDISWDKVMFKDRIVDCLQRFCGGFNFIDDSGFGHPFDLVALEITAQPQFNGEMGENEGNSWGQVAINSPHCFGPEGVETFDMGSGNGL